MIEILATAVAHGLTNPELAGIIASVNLLNLKIFECEFVRPELLVVFVIGDEPEFGAAPPLKMHRRGIRLNGYMQVDEYRRSFEAGTLHDDLVRPTLRMLVPKYLSESDEDRLWSFLTEGADK